MKRNQGFTLVELVIVIVILGILAVTAAPKFLNLSSDARISTLNGVKGSIESANALIYGKAILANKQTAATHALTNPAVNIVYGYVDSTGAALTAVLDMNTDDWLVADATANTTLSIAAGDAVIQPKSSAALTGTTTEAEACALVYKKAAAPGTKPTISLKTGGC